MVSVFFALVSAGSMYWYLEEKTYELENRNKIEIVQRIVASKVVKSGSRLSHNDLAVRGVPADFISQDSYSVDQVALVVGKMVIADLRPGELLTRLHLTEIETQDLAAKIDAGHRAITIPVDQINSISGLLKPTDKIDLFVSFEHSGKRVTAPLVENVTVLATGKSLTIGDDPGSIEHGNGFATVTLSVTAAQAVKIVAARQDGKITAVLSGRSPVNHTVDKGFKQTAGDLPGLLGMSHSDHDEVQAAVIYGDLMQQDPSYPLPFEARKPMGEFFDAP